MENGGDQEEPKIELFVKAASDGTSLGDCVFCQRVFMILCLKKIKFSVTTVDMTKKHLFKALPSLGTKIPFLMIDGEEPITDVTEMANYLEKRLAPPMYPKLEPNNPEAAMAGTEIFQKFSKFIKNSSQADEERLQRALYISLVQLNEFLIRRLPDEIDDDTDENSPSERKFLDGDQLTHPDCNLLPKLHHVRVATKALKGFEIPQDLTGLWRYLNSAYETEEFKKTLYPDEEVTKTWQKHMESSAQMSRGNAVHVAPKAS
ncbi:chloride intracellular channel protein 4-like isoform X1 [Branchiostoma lanceolatum]|uniref:CLIC4 protein n=1 Tax=Branchiostoma lanceolatum TaxID=7740 RepID=A0A8J9YP09_BRALA|nr:CLIC4 [Branchiostoma lanceolatum]